MWEERLHTPPYLMILTQRIERNRDKVSASSDHLYIKSMKYEPLSHS